ncbi:MAG: TatD family hydrolase [Candidatus Omnitrophica bacterium]|nr:TatD family hydrolase [Candidatus Omnitrophota bacterium]
MIDTHCHLESVEQLNEALLEAKESGITGILAVGEDYESNRKTLAITSGQNPVKAYAALGLHPGKVTAEQTENTLSQIRENIDKISAIGETGLDFWIKTAKSSGQQELQVKSFKRHIEIANKYNLAISAHSRGAWEEALKIAESECLKKCVFHWYSGPLNILEKIIKAGYYISATPALEYSVQHIEAIKNAPLEKILIETDSPVTYKPAGGIYKAGPKNLSRTANALAKIKQTDIKQIIEICDKTAKAVFNLK